MATSRPKDTTTTTSSTAAATSSVASSSSAISSSVAGLPAIPAPVPSHLSSPLSAPPSTVSPARPLISPASIADSSPLSIEILARQSRVVSGATSIIPTPTMISSSNLAVSSSSSKNTATMTSNSTINTTNSTSTHQSTSSLTMPVTIPILSSKPKSTTTLSLASLKGPKRSGQVSSSLKKASHILQTEILWADAHRFLGRCHQCKEEGNEVLFDSYEGFCAHLKQHYGRQFLTCEFCGKVSAHKSNFISHLSRHTRAAPFRCAIGECRTTTSTRQNMVTHIGRVHHLKVIGIMQQRKRLKAQTEAAIAAINRPGGRPLSSTSLATLVGNRIRGRNNVKSSSSKSNSNTSNVFQFPNGVTPPVSSSTKNNNNNHRRRKSGEKNNKNSHLRKRVKGSNHAGFPQPYRVVPEMNLRDGATMADKLQMLRKRPTRMDSRRGIIKLVPPAAMPLSTAAAVSEALGKKLSDVTPAFESASLQSEKRQARLKAQTARIKAQLRGSGNELGSSPSGLVMSPPSDSLRAYHSLVQSSRAKVSGKKRKKSSEDHVFDFASLMNANGGTGVAVTAAAQGRRVRRMGRSHTPVLDQSAPLKVRPTPESVLNGLPHFDFSIPPPFKVNQSGDLVFTQQQQKPHVELMPLDGMWHALDYLLWAAADIECEKNPSLSDGTEMMPESKNHCDEESTTTSVMSVSIKSEEDAESLDSRLENIESENTRRKSSSARTWKESTDTPIWDEIVEVTKPMQNLKMELDSEDTMRKTDSDATTVRSKTSLIGIDSMSSATDDSDDGQNVEESTEDVKMTEADFETVNALVESMDVQISDICDVKHSEGEDDEDDNDDHKSKDAKSSENQSNRYSELKVDTSAIDDRLDSYFE